jgi:hypothetical protein
VSAVKALTWATEVGAADLNNVPPITPGAADLLRRLDFPIPPAAGAPVRPPVPAAGLLSPTP